MTDTATRQDDVDVAEQQHDTEPYEDQGGSPLGEDDRVVGADGKPIEEAPAEDQSSDEQPSGDPRIADLERQIAERQNILDAIYERMEEDPELRDRLDGKSPKTANDWRSHAETKIREGLEPAAADVVLSAFNPIFDHFEKLEGQVGQIGPQLQDVRRSVGGAEFRSNLNRNGIPRETQETQGWGRFIKELRHEPTFKSLEAKNPGFAADFAASKWKARQAERAGHRDDLDRLRSAVGGRTGTREQRGSSLAKQVYQLKRDGGQVDRAAQIRFKDPGAIIKYVD